MRTSKYTKEFKDSTIQLILNSNESVPKVATDLDIHVKTLYSWMSSYKKAHNMPMRGMNTSSSNETLDEEIKRLRKENKLLKQERDILKKATAPRGHLSLRSGTTSPKKFYKVRMDERT